MEKGKHSSWSDGSGNLWGGSAWRVCRVAWRPHSWSRVKEGGLDIRLKTGGPRVRGLSGVIHSSHPTVLATQQQGDAFQNPDPLLYPNLFRASPGSWAKAPAPHCAPQGLCTSSHSQPCCPLCSHHIALILTQTIPSAWTSLPSSIPPPASPSS